MDAFQHLPMETPGWWFKTTGKNFEQFEVNTGERILPEQLSSSDDNDISPDKFDLIFKENAAI